MDYEEWKRKNESTLQSEFIDMYEDMFENHCKASYESENKNKLIR